MTDMTSALPEPLRGAVAARLTAWRAMDGTRRLWAKDATLWTGKDEARWLGWLDIAAAERGALGKVRQLAEDVRADGLVFLAVIGMGGSSLCPDVLGRTFGLKPANLRPQVMDSTDPAQLHRFENALDLRRTLFVVSSKSGSTLEPSILRDYFLARVRDFAGDRAGDQFIAITDPGSQLEQQARQDGFRAILPGVPEIGGRFSALSHFGMVPAALAGIDVDALLGHAEEMAEACRDDDPARNPGVALGVLLAEAAAQGRDKLMLVASPGLEALGGWLEQLVAESTGKQGHAVLPVDGEPLVSPDHYGSDRLFVQLRLTDAGDDPNDAALAALEGAGQPVARIPVAGVEALGAEFFRWEFATAVCGAVMGVNPFDQPDVEASKVATRRITDEYEAKGALPHEESFVHEKTLKLFADRANITALTARGSGLVKVLRTHLRRIGAGDYFAILAWLEMSDAHREVLQAIRLRVRDAKQVATTLGFGPRFLHSTGQAHKGGPNSGVFLQVTSEDEQDLLVPGRRYSFGTVKAAQARGDFAVLAERGRRALRVHLGADVEAGLRALDSAVRQALL